MTSPTIQSLGFQGGKSCTTLGIDLSTVDGAPGTEGLHIDVYSNDWSPAALQSIDDALSVLKPLGVGLVKSVAVCHDALGLGPLSLCEPGHAKALEIDFSRHLIRSGCCVDACADKPELVKAA